jgi:hypothetical protein
MLSNVVKILANNSIDIFKDVIGEKIHVKA